VTGARPVARIQAIALHQVSPAGFVIFVVMRQQELGTHMDKFGFRPDFPQ